MEFEWDEAKHAKTLCDRGIGFDDGARIFAGPVLIWEDARREYGEGRFRAVGETNGVTVTVYAISTRERRAEGDKLSP